MTTINDQYINALLADAAYAKDLADGMSPTQLRDALKTSMTLPLADFISANFTVASHIESGEILGSGFDATVWRGNAGTPYEGQVYVSMQGTLGLGDWLTDVDIAANGTALMQYETMVNWWLKISTPVGQTAKQVAFVQGQGFVAAPSVAGTGQVAGSRRSRGQVLQTNIYFYSRRSVQCPERHGLRVARNPCRVERHGQPHPVH